MHNKPMRVAVYARVSTSDQCCEVQLTELRRYVESHGWSIHEEYVDTGFSGKTKDRPALKKCLKDAMSRQFDCVVVYKLDRWGRTVKQLVDDILTFDSAGIRFIAATQGIDTDQNNPMSRLMLHIMAAFAEFERAIILERVGSGYRQYREDFAAGRIGRSKHSKSGKDLPVGRQRVITDRQKIWDLRDKGQSIRAICEETGLTHGVVQRIAAAGRIQ